MSRGLHWRRHLGWLWLSVMSFTALMLLITYETRWVHPDINAYFSQSGNLTGQQLATRSRRYLEESLRLLLEEGGSDAARDRAGFQIDLGYSLFDIGLYRNEYACTITSLERLDELQQRLAQEEMLAPASLSQHLLGPIRCLTVIEMDQLDRRSQVTNEFVDQTRRHQTQVLVGSLLIYLLGLVFWWMHERRRRQVERANRESLRWMAQALRDPLTGIGNRTALHDDVMADRGRALGLILIDIDFFKQYNDALGHPDGDRLLRELAGLIDTALGRRARLYRMGGDEFAALLPCDDEATLAEACRRLVAEVQRAALPHPGHAVGTQVTLSVGATHFKAAPDTFAAAYASADQALYHVKAHGRDGWRLCRLAACPG